MGFRYEFATAATPPRQDKVFEIETSPLSLAPVTFDGRHASGWLLDVREVVVAEVEVADGAAAGPRDGGEGFGAREAVVGAGRRRRAGRRGRTASEERRAPAMESSSSDGTRSKRAGEGRRPVEDLTAPSRVRVLGAEKGELGAFFTDALMARSHAAPSSPAAAGRRRPCLRWSRKFGGGADKYGKGRKHGCSPHAGFFWQDAGGFNRAGRTPVKMSVLYGHVAAARSVCMDTKGHLVGRR
jgi:hypothetical protein